MMTSRERVIGAIERKDLDRTPIDLGGTAVSTILAEAYDKLLKKLNIKKDIRIADTSQLFVYVDDEIVDLYNLDVAPLYPLRDFMGVRRDKGWKAWHTPHDGTPVKIFQDFNPEEMDDGSYIWKIGGYIYRLPSKGFYFDAIKSPLEDAETVSDIEKYHIPVMDDEEKEWYRKGAKELREKTDKFIVADIIGGWTDIAGPMMGNANFYMAIAANKPVVHALMEKLNYVWKKRVEILKEVAGDNIDAIVMYSDLGTEKGGIYSNGTVREMVIPYIKDFYDYVRKISNYYIVFHSCGSIYQYLPDLIDAGVNILNPVQVGAADMEPEKLKKEFGKYITFWGGAVDPQHELAYGTPEKVSDYAMHATRIFKEGGGFVFTQPHNVQPGVPPENVIALYEAGNKYGRY
jgi:uroporphyrinogen decarboxylase